MNKRKTLIFIIAVSVCIATLWLFLVISAKVIRRLNEKASSVESTAQDSKPYSNITVGNHDIYMELQKTIVNLPSGATLQFAEPNQMYDVPDFVFDKKYSDKNTQIKNYIPIEHKVALYDKGYEYIINNLGCDKAVQQLDDTPDEEYVSGCSLRVAISKATPPQTIQPSFTIQETTSMGKHLFSGSVDNVPNSTLLRLSYWGGPVYSDGGGRPSLESTNDPTVTWDMDIMTNYGVATFRYTAQELADRVSKTIKLGGVELTSHIDVVSGSKTSKINVTYKQTDANEPIKIVDYSR